MLVNQLIGFLRSAFKSGQPYTEQVKEAFDALFHGSLQAYMEWTRSTAVYPTVATDPKLVECFYLSLGLGNEAGEVQGLIKKWHRDGVIDKSKVKKELGDVMWYWARMCDALDIDPQEVLLANQNKLQDRKVRGTLQGSGDDR